MMYLKITRSEVPAQLHWSFQVLNFSLFLFLLLTLSKQKDEEPKIQFDSQSSHSLQFLRIVHDRRYSLACSSAGFGYLFKC